MQIYESRGHVDQRSGATGRAQLKDCESNLVLTMLVSTACETSYDDQKVVSDENDPFPAPPIGFRNSSQESGCTPIQKNKQDLYITIAYMIANMTPEIRIISRSGLLRISTEQEFATKGPSQQVKHGGYDQPAKLMAVRKGFDE